jgi:hypothetical protein
MKIKMLQRTLGSGNKSGNGTKWYEQDEIIDCKEEWQKDLANTFVSSGLAIEIKTIEPTETKTKAKPKKKKAVKK